MTVDPSMRAGDADRERVAEILRTAYAEGRLDAGEFDQRLAAAYAAKTLGELAPLTRDLPTAAPTPEVASRAVPARRSTTFGLSAFGWTALALVALTVLTKGRSAVLLFALIPWGVMLARRGRPPKERPGRQDGERDHR